MAAIDQLQRQLDANGLRISNLGTPTTALDATYTDLSTNPANPAAAASPGTSKLAAPADHVHQGVHSLHSDGNANIYGDARLVSGAGITLSQSGNDITITANSNTVNKVTWAEDRQAYVVGNTEQIVSEFNVNLDDAGGGAGNNIAVRLSAIVKTSSGTGTFKVYVGATAPGSTSGGTVRATATTTSTTFELQTNLGSAFSNPGGQQLVQLVAVGSAGGITATVRGAQYSIG